MSLDLIEKCPWKLGDYCTFLKSMPPCMPDEDWCPMNEEYYEWLKQESEDFENIFINLSSWTRSKNSLVF